MIVVLGNHMYVAWSKCKNKQSVGIKMCQKDRHTLHKHFHLNSSVVNDSKLWRKYFRIRCRFPGRNILPLADDVNKGLIRFYLNDTSLQHLWRSEVSDCRPCTPCDIHVILCCFSSYYSQVVVKETVSSYLQDNFFHEKVKHIL